MALDLTTPALLFPAISLLLLAYTNRFLTLATIVRGLRQRHRESPDPAVRRQLDNLRLRLRLIRDMQAVGSTALLLSVVCMFLIYAGLATAGAVVFGVALVLLTASLALSVVEIAISTRALQLELGDLESDLGRAPAPGD